MIKKTSFMLLTIICIMLLLPVMSVVDAFNLDPQETIRLRVIPHSNTIRDQGIKHQVRRAIEQDLARILADVNDIETARSITEEQIPVLEQRINRILHQNNVRHHVSIEYGLHHFPRTSHLGLIFPAGQYESMIVTIGQGRGSNWWCILFPPHCLIEARSSDQIEYRSFFKDLISRIIRR